MTPEILTHAKKLFDYMNIDSVTEEADVTIAFGTSDNDPARRAAQLYLDGFAPKTLFSGKGGEMTTLKREHSEAASL